MSEADKFAAEIDAEWKAMQMRARNKVIEITDFVFGNIQRISPVDTGRFRANWNAAVGIPDPHTTRNTDKRSSSTLARARGKISEYKHFTNWPPIYISNGLPYAQRLEDGYSKQAPKGVASVSIANANYKFSGVEI